MKTQAIKTAAQLFKMISFAYPTSITATKAGKKNGCYFVQLLTEGWDVEGRQPHLYFDTKPEAIAYADSLPQPYHPGYLRLYDIRDGHRHKTYEEAMKVNPTPPADSLHAYSIVNGKWERGAIIAPDSRKITLYDKDDNGQMQPFGIGIY